MNRLLLVGLMLCCIAVWGCNKQADEKSDSGGMNSRAESIAASGEEAVLGESAPDVQTDGEEAQHSGEMPANEEYIALVLEIAPEFGIRHEVEADLLYTPEGKTIGTPTDIASHVDLITDPSAGHGITDPHEAIKFLLEELVRPAEDTKQEMSSTEPVEETAPAEEKLDLAGMNTKQMVIALTSEYGLSYDSGREVLTGSGFPTGGIGIGTIVSKVDLNLSQSGERSDASREAEVRTVLEQLAATGQQTADQQSSSSQSTAAVADSADPGRGRKPLEYNPDRSELIHPAEVFGDWKSIREDHPNFEVDHNEEYFWDVQLRFRGNAIFRLHKNGELFSDTEFPYSYDLRTGTLALQANDGSVTQTYTVWATERDPLLIWLQRENSKVKTLYQKVGLGGKPVSEEEFIAGLRELLGEEGVQNYLKYKESQQQSGN
jgi:hypothetical protein